MTKVGLIVPTLNAGNRWQEWLEALGRQTRKPDYLLVIDSSSDDHTVQLARNHGFEVRIIPKSEFSHGGTRQLGVKLLSSAELIVFLTQDAILTNAEAIEKLVATFADPQVGLAYGRQLPHLNAGPIAAHARLFNYPAESQVRSLGDRSRYGIKTVFVSNSFAAYRRSALIQAGGFPLHTIMNEDTYVAGKMLLVGWKIAYCAGAQVYHSHDYGFRDEFRRYFDIGVFHRSTDWFSRSFGGTTKEGLRFVRSETQYLLRHAPWLIPSAMLRTGLKWLGFKLGVYHLRLPSGLRRSLSFHKAFWLQPNSGTGGGTPI